MALSGFASDPRTRGDLLPARLSPNIYGAGARAQKEFHGPPTYPPFLPLQPGPAQQGLMHI